jgi:simple sugar transport system substrate-binding protein
MRKLAAIILCVFAFNLSSCSKTDVENNIPTYEKKLVLGFAQLGDESEWRTANSESIKAAANEAGIELKFYNAQQSQANQIKAIRSFIAQKVDVIAFAPIVRSGWENVLIEAKEAGIPVIITDRDIEVSDKSLYAAFIGSNFYEEGQKAAEWLIKKREDLGLRDSINVVEIRGTTDSAPAVHRKDGFETLLENYKGIKITKSETGDFMRSKGKEVMEGFLSSKGEKIDVIYSHNDDMALGAIEAIEAAGLKPGKDIVIISIDATKEAFKAVMEGKINCTIECNPIIGPELMKAVEDLMNGKTIPSKILTKVNVFDKNNVLQELPNRKY